ncbi:MAG TPA: translation initiation factor IF-2 N-terminal domain-containing protein, partial [Polyangiaceae bacterium]
MSSKLRVYEVARDLGMDNKELATLLQSIGFSEIKNHMSVVPPEAIERAKRQLERRNEPNKVVEERIRPTVVKRRAAAKRPDDPHAHAGSAGAESSPLLEVAPVVVPEPPPVIVHAPPAEVTAEPVVSAAPVPSAPVPSTPEMAPALEQVASVP